MARMASSGGRDTRESDDVAVETEESDDVAVRVWAWRVDREGSRRPHSRLESKYMDDRRPPAGSNAPVLHESIAVPVRVCV